MDEEIKQMLNYRLRNSDEAEIDPRREEYNRELM